jgi:perosamine synthetase
MNKFIPQMEPWFDEKEAKAVNKYMQGDGWLTEFTKTEDLEKMIAKYTNAKFCVMTFNGTVSLILALLALGIKRDDEVLVPDITQIATPNAAALLGIKPVFVDVEPNTLCMDLNLARSAITPKTKAVLYVSLNGNSENMNHVKKFCRDHGLFLVEDAAQSLGSYSNNKHLGTYGDIGTLSFAVPKIITTGQGGALLTNSRKLYNKIKKLKDFGRTRGGIDTHDEWGWNFKFTDLQAVIGIEQMKKLSFRIIRKKEIYKRYLNGLKDVKEIKFIVTDLTKTCPWSIDIYVKNPLKLASYLKNKGIGARRVYPAIHTQKIYRNTQYNGQFPVAEKYARTGLWLPSSSKLTNKEVDYIIAAINQYYSESSN